MRTTHPHRARFAIRLLALPLLGLTAACTEAAAPDRVIGGGLLLELVKGDDQTFIQGFAPGPFVVRVVDINGEPRSGMPVQWRVVEGDGWLVHTQQVRELETTTDENGLGTVRWRMGFAPWEQAMEVSAGDRSLRVEVVVEPQDWRDVLGIDPVAEVVDGRLRARLRIVNQWVRTLAFRPSCFFEAHLLTLNGQPVQGWDWVKCQGFVSTTRFLGPGAAFETGTTDHAWRIETAQLEPGVYAVVFKFYDDFKLRDRLTNLHDRTVMVAVE